MQVRYRAALHPDFLRWYSNKIPVVNQLVIGLRVGRAKISFIFQNCEIAPIF